MAGRGVWEADREKTKGRKRLIANQCLFLGILWERTRNLWLLMAIHAMFDLLPGLSEFIKVWGI